MEAANVLLVPGFALVFGFPRTMIETIAIVLAAIATAGFLVVGAAYWRGVDRRLRLDDRAMVGRALGLADRVERPILVVMAGAGAATVAALLSVGWSQSVIAAALLTILAAVEYLNYYQWQLQHFDNWADFKRLFAGRRPKTAHMARDLAVWRKRRALSD